MEIFKWVEDIETLYRNLIDKAKQKNLDELKALKKEAEERLDITITKKQNLVNNILKALSEEVDRELEKLNQNLDQVIEEIEIFYQKNKDEVKTTILHKIGFDF